MYRNTTAQPCIAMWGDAPPVAAPTSLYRRIYVSPYGGISLWCTATHCVKFRYAPSPTEGHPALSQPDGRHQTGEYHLLSAHSDLRTYILCRYCTMYIDVDILHIYSLSDVIRQVRASNAEVRSPVMLSVDSEMVLTLTKVNAPLTTSDTHCVV